MSSFSSTPGFERRPPLAEDEYPDSDGNPMAENDPQYDSITDTNFALDYHFRNDPLVYVAADLLIYYEEGNRNQSVAPDVFVALGVPKGRRRTYLIWAEGKAPDVVFEIASPSSWRADVGWKRGLYASLGVREYFLFDPAGEYFHPPLQGFRLVHEAYELLPVLDAKRGWLGVHSEVLGLEVWARRIDEQGMPYALRLYDPAVDRWLPTPADETAGREAAEREAAEARALREAAERSAAEAHAQREAAEERIAKLEAELRKLQQPEP